MRLLYPEGRRGRQAHIENQYLVQGVKPVIIKACETLNDLLRIKQQSGFVINS
jgi:hypothetical protein